MSEDGRARRMQLEKLFGHIRTLFKQHDDYMRRTNTEHGYV